MQQLYRVNYEEYLHYEEFIEASSSEEAERIFRNSINTIEPIEGETYTFDVTAVLDDKTKESTHVADSKIQTSK
jgi:hypothetical protein